MELRVYHVINPPSEGKEYPVKNIDEALQLIKDLANQQFFDTTNQIYSLGLEVFNEEDGMWEEWYDENDNSIDDYELINGKAVLIKP